MIAIAKIVKHKGKEIIDHLVDNYFSLNLSSFKNERICNKK